VRAVVGLEFRPVVGLDHLDLERALPRSITYVAALSLWALVSGHWSAWQAARVEVNQEQEQHAGDDATSLEISSSGW
jgi:hypothetical protein